MTTFKPVQRQPKTEAKGHILLVLTPEVYSEVRVASLKSGVSMKEFARQAIRFALDSMETSA